MVTKRKVTKRKSVKSKAPVSNNADKKVAETAIAARKRRHTGQID